MCVAITGGAGQIAYALVPLILHGRVFGEGRKVRLRLLDIEPCAKALEGVAMEIQDCYSDLVSAVFFSPRTPFIVFRPSFLSPSYCSKSCYSDPTSLALLSSSHYSTCLACMFYIRRLLFSWGRRYYLAVTCIYVTVPTHDRYDLR